MKLATYIAIIVTLATVVCVGIALYTIHYSGLSVLKFKTLGLNELGDFFAGTFSALAFMWLIITMMMQRDELQLQHKVQSDQFAEMANTRKVLETEISHLQETLALQRTQVTIAKLDILENRLEKQIKITLLEENIAFAQTETAIEAFVRYSKDCIRIGNTQQLRNIPKLDSFRNVWTISNEIKNIFAQLPEEVIFYPIINEFIEMFEEVRSLDGNN